MSRSHRCVLVSASLVVGLLLAAFPGGAAASAPLSLDRGTTAAPRSPLADAIRNRVEAAALIPEHLSVNDDRVRAAASLGTFYERRVYEPAWVTEEGLSPAGRALVHALAASRRDGLEPDDYHVPEIREIAGELNAAGGKPETGRLVDLELLLTDGFLLYGSHLVSGRLDPATLHADWEAEPRERDLVAVLEEAVQAGTPAAFLVSLRPPQPGYARLMEALAAYRELAARGGWPSVPDGPKLSPGDASERVPALRARLAAVPEVVEGPADSGSAVASAPSDSLVYDPALTEEVKDFQRRHGLEPDGVVGANTLTALNASPADRVRQLEVNLERWRWLPQELGDRYVIVNAADYRLDAVESGEATLTMRAIVGKAYRQTPVFSDRISYMVFSPYWHVPHNLAVQDQLPLQKKDPTYFSRLGFRVFRGWGADAAEVDPAAVDWSSVTPRYFGFRLRQDPGPQNFLGGVKFMFPNPYSVYLHDTPAKELFGRQARSFSSGCIRIEKARELASWLLRGDGDWTPERIDRAMNARSEQTVRMRSSVPVHLLYWTAFVGDDASVQFRPDVYDRDTPVARALDREAPVASPPTRPLLPAR